MKKTATLVVRNKTPKIRTETTLMQTRIQQTTTTTVGVCDGGSVDGLDEGAHGGCRNGLRGLGAVRVAFGEQSKIEDGANKRFCSIPKDGFFAGSRWGSR